MKKVGDERKPSTLVSLRKTVLATVVVTSILGFSGIASVYKIFPDGVEHGIWTTARDNGFAVMREDTRLRETVTRLPKYIDRLMSRPDLPTLSFDIKFVDMQKLEAKRIAAVKAGLLEASDDDYVSATITGPEGSVRAKLRLKGDNIDHLGSRKWSMRIHVKGDEQIFGLRHFSIQHPKTRGFYAENLFHETLRDFDILVPRYSFVNVVINGDSIGIMAMEEFFSKELLERQGRKEGVMLKFDEFFRWNARDMKNFRASQNYTGPFESYLNAGLHVFQSAAISKSPELKRQLRLAIGLMRGFLNGEIEASKAFDVERLGAYLAASEFWGAAHPVHWTNLRFYFNPLTLKLEPIAYDANIQTRSPIGRSIARNPIVVRMVRDRAVYEAFKNSHSQLVEQFEEGNLLGRLREVEGPLLDILRSEFFMLEPFDAEIVRSRARSFANVLRPDIVLARTPIYLHAYFVSDEQGDYLEVLNALPHDVEVKEIFWADEFGSRSQFNAVQPVELPLSLPITEIGGIPESIRIDYLSTSENEGRSLHVVASLVGFAQTIDVIAGQNFPPITASLMPEANISQVLRDHAFLELAPDGKTIEIQPGTWDVDGGIIIPVGYDLVIGPGTTLRFGQSASMIVYGATRFLGVRDGRIILEGKKVPTSKPGHWQGILVFGALSRSIWSYVTVRNTTGIDSPNLKLTGGITFYKSDVTIRNSKISGSSGEDALNIVHSNFYIDKVEIIDTLSDGFDADFSTGTIRSSTFADIGTAGGGDGFDVSGSDVKVFGTRFENIGDKAMSVGEGSNLTARDILIERSPIGIASKDGSNVTVSDSTIRLASYAALMSYTKKAEYGSASLSATNVKVENSARVSQVQAGNVLTINGETMSAEKFDVNALYQTVMKPGIER